MSQDLSIVRNWMKFFDLSLSDIDLVGELEDQKEEVIKDLLESVEEDRARLTSDGVWVSRDFSKWREYEDRRNF